MQSFSTAIPNLKGAAAYAAPTERQYEPLISDAEAGKFLGNLHPKTIQRLARARVIPAYRIGRFWRYRASELSEWLMLHSTRQIDAPAHNREEKIQ